jgi:hypothetical protein
MQQELRNDLRTCSTTVPAVAWRRTLFLSRNQLKASHIRAPIFHFQIPESTVTYRQQHFMPMAHVLMQTNAFTFERLRYFRTCRVSMRKAVENFTASICSLRKLEILVGACRALAHIVLEVDASPMHCVT